MHFLKEKFKHDKRHVSRVTFVMLASNKGSFFQQKTTFTHIKQHISFTPTSEEFPFPEQPTIIQHPISIVWYWRLGA